MMRAVLKAGNLVKACLLWMLQNAALQKPWLQHCFIRWPLQQGPCSAAVYVTKQMHFNNCLHDLINLSFMLRFVLFYAPCQGMQYKRRFSSKHQSNRMVLVQRGTGHNIFVVLFYAPCQGMQYKWRFSFKHQSNRMVLVQRGTGHSIFMASPGLAPSHCQYALLL